MASAEGETDPPKKKFNIDRIWGSAPWLKPVEKQYFKAKVFKSGNSLAVRIPAGTKLSAGTEMDLTIEDGVFLSLEPVKLPKRKFNIAKVAGSATSLKLIRDGDRVFVERPLAWGDTAHPIAEGPTE